MFISYLNGKYVWSSMCLLTQIYEYTFPPHPIQSGPEIRIPKEGGEKMEKPIFLLMFHALPSFSSPLHLSIRPPHLTPD